MLYELCVILWVRRPEQIFWRLARRIGANSFASEPFRRSVPVLFHGVQIAIAWQ